MDVIVNELVSCVALAVQGTPLSNKSVNVTKVKTMITEQLTKTLSRVSIQDKSKILKFLNNDTLIKQCIIPSIGQILDDGKLNTADIPVFLNMIIEIYDKINEFIQSNKGMTINSTDIIELSSLLIKIVLTFFIADLAQLQLSISLIDSAIKLVSLTIKAKTWKLKCCCCK